MNKIELNCYRILKEINGDNLNNARHEPANISGIKRGNM
jgi:hypothetical protein